MDYFSFYVLYIVFYLLILSKGLINRVYFVASDKFIKIGFSKNPYKRLKQLSTGSDTKLWLIGFVDGNKELEKQLHIQFTKANLEWYYPTDELLEYINSNNKLNYTVEFDGNKLMIYKKMKCV